MMKYMDWRGKTLFVMALSIYLLITYWLLWPYKPITIHNLTIKNKDKIAYVGEFLLYGGTYTKTASYPVVSVSRQLINDYVIDLSPIHHSNVPLGTYTKIMRAKIPLNTDPGKYVFHLSVTYKVNPIRTITFKWESGQFAIRKKQQL